MQKSGTFFKTLTQKPQRIESVAPFDLKFKIKIIRNILEQLQFAKVRAKPPTKCGFRLARKGAKTCQIKRSFFAKQKTSKRASFCERRK